MKKYKSFLIVLLSIIVLSSCSKKDNDPAPAGGPTGTRLKSVESTDSLFHTASYSYDGNNRVSNIIWRDSADNIVQEDQFEYNTSGKITKENTIWENNAVSYTYEYNTEGLLLKRKFYGDATQTILYQTLYYTYDSNNNLSYFIKESIAGSNTFRDSTVYLNYTDGYPADMHFYNTPSGLTERQLLFKRRYTYDSRKNCIKTEEAKGTDPDTYELREERNYETVNDLGTWIELTDEYGINVSERNYEWPVPLGLTKDYYLDYNSYVNNNRYLTTFKRRITEKNSEGLPTKQTIEILHSVDGVNYDSGASYEFVYESY